MQSIAKQIAARPFYSVGIAALAGLWLGAESPRRGILIGLVRMLVMHELRTFVDTLPPPVATVIPPRQVMAS